MTTDPIIIAVAATLVACVWTLWWLNRRDNARRQSARDEAARRARATAERRNAVAPMATVTRPRPEPEPTTMSVEVVRAGQWIDEAATAGPLVVDDTRELDAVRRDRAYLAAVIDEKDRQLDEQDRQLDEARRLLQAAEREIQATRLLLLGHEVNVAGSAPRARGFLPATPDQWADPVSGLRVVRKR